MWPARREAVHDGWSIGDQESKVVEIPVQLEQVVRGLPVDAIEIELSF